MPEAAAKIDVEQLEELAMLHCTIEEAAAFFGCTKRALLDHLDDRARDPAYSEAWERGRNKGKASLRRLQWQHAQMANSAGVTMTIHLSRHWLGETAKSLEEIAGKDGGLTETRATIDLSKLTDAELAAYKLVLAATERLQRGD